MVDGCFENHEGVVVMNRVVFARQFVGFWEAVVFDFVALAQKSILCGIEPESQVDLSLLLLINAVCACEDHIGRDKHGSASTDEMGMIAVSPKQRTDEAMKTVLHFLEGD